MIYIKNYKKFYLIIFLLLIWFSKTSAAVPTAGLEGYWSFDEGQGTVVSDLSGNNNTGTLVNNPTWTNGKVGNGAIRFNGGTDYVSIPQTENISTVYNNGGGGMTISLWVKPSVLGNSLFSLGQGSDNEWTSYLVNTGRVGFQTSYNGGALNERFDNQLAVDRWNHLVYTWDGSFTSGTSVSFYKDGVKQTLTFGTGGVGTPVDNPGEPLLVGTSYVGTAGFNGTIDELRIYNRVLSQAEITELYNYNGVSEPASPTITNGSCSATLNSCQTGNFSDTADSTTEYLWNCQGINGGITAQCSSLIPQIPTTYTLAVTKNGSGDGTITGTGISCGTDCSETINSNTSITLTATPVSGSTFVGWSGSGCSGTGVCTVNMSSTITVTATFNQQVVSTPSNINCSATNIRCVPEEYSTIQACANATLAGDTCLVNTGNYPERVSLTRSGSSVANTITFVANGVVTVCGLDFTSTNYIRVIGFTLDSDSSGCPSSQGSVIINGTNSYLEFWNNTMRDAVNNGIRTGWGSSGKYNNSLIIGNTFLNFGIGNGSGVAVSTRGDNNLIAYNEVYNIHPDAFVIFGSNNRLINNYIHNLTEVSGGHSDIFQTGSMPEGFFNNLFEGNLQIAMGNTGDEHTAQISNGQASTYCPNGCGAMTENIFRRNVWHDVSSGTIGINQAFDGPISFTRYYNNTTADACVVSSAANVRYGLAWYSSGVSNGYIHNNIEYESWGDNVSSNLEVYYVEGGLTADYNLAYDPDGPVTFANVWNSQLHRQSNTNPFFVDYNNNNFTLGVSSGAINTGGPLTTVSGSGTGTTFNVATNGGGFFRGDNTNISQYGGNLVVGDTITIGNDMVTIANISGDTITVTSPFTWINGEGVYFDSDNTPDIGAYPYKQSYSLSGTWSKSGDVVIVTVNDPSLVRFVVVFEDGIPKGVDSSYPYSVNGIGGGVVTAKLYSLYASMTPVINISNGITTQIIPYVPPTTTNTGGSPTNTGTNTNTNTNTGSSSGGGSVVTNSTGNLLTTSSAPSNGNATTAELEAQIAKLIAMIKALQSKQETVQKKNFVFTKNLTLGSRNSEVTNLQKYLNSDPETKVSSNGPGSSGYETNYFGLATKTAIQKFQVKYNIAQPGTGGYGIFGPKTRAKINDLLK